MAILFFDGFDRCTITKDLDKNYWSFEPQQPVEYEKYAFGGYSYDHSQDSYVSNYYQYYSPNNAIEPSGTFDDGADNGFLCGGFGAYYYEVYGNNYPGFGQPLGFLALNNLDITDPNLLAPITYLQVSGFAPPQSGQSFLSTRILGIETKDSNYAYSDKPGRFGHKHPLVAFCSGNTTGLILNIVKVTGNHIGVIENEKMTIGLEIEQLSGVSGTFDLNISQEITNFKIRSIFNDTIPGYTSGDMAGRILTLATNDTYPLRNTPVGSRWCHFQFGIIQTGDVPYIQIKLEDIDLLQIPFNDAITNKDLWEDRVYISGFNYDNIRFFNRTYYNVDYTTMYSYSNQAFERNCIRYFDNIYRAAMSKHYMFGAVTLLDDIILSDGSGTPSNFLGSNAKVVPFTPGLNTNLSNNGIVNDGLRQWTTNDSSHRTALKNLDGDNGKISSSTPNTITAVRYKNDNIKLTDDPNSQWRTTLEDAIGGVKVYVQDKKEFLDSSYEIIMSTGNNDAEFIDKVRFILNGDITSNEVLDRTRKYSFTKIGDVTATLDNTVFNNHESIKFNDSYVYTSNIDLSPSYTNSNSLLINNLFTLESWVYFTGDHPCLLFGSKPPSGYQDPVYVYGSNFEILCYRDRLQYNYYIEDTIRDQLELYFPQSIPTGEWNHVALARDANDSDSGYTYPLIVFLNGISGTSYRYKQNLDADDYLLDNDYTGSEMYYSSFNWLVATGLSINNIDLGPISYFDNLVVDHGTVSGSGSYSNPVTGIFNFNIDNVSNKEKQLLDFDINTDGLLVFQFSSFYTNNDDHPFGVKVKKNNNNQILRTKPTSSSYWRQDLYDFIDSSFGFLANIYTLSLPVASGDKILLYVNNLSTVYSSNYNFYLHSGYITDIKTYNNLFHLPTGYNYNGFYSHVPGMFGNFNQFYSLSTIPNNDTTLAQTNFYPTFFGGNNYLSDTRLTQGGLTIGSEVESRYPVNFIVQNDFFRSKDDDYIKLGDTQNVTKTRYGSVKQFYELNNPVTQEPWTTGLINSPSGILFGVRKL